MRSLVQGYTKVIGLIADPVEKAKSPGLVNDLLLTQERYGSYVMVPMQVASASLPAFIYGLREMQNFAGAVVSMPHKIAITELVDELTPAAMAVGAVNVIRREPGGRLVGALFDGDGFVGGLLAQGYSVKGKHCILAGAGGAGAAIAYALAVHGCASLTLINRTPERAIRLAARINDAFPTVKMRTDIDSHAAYELMVNATSLGMVPGDPLPFPEDVIARSRIVAECVVTQDETLLLAYARQAGCRTQAGIHMLTSQLELMTQFITSS